MYGLRVQGRQRPSNMKYKVAPLLPPLHVRSDVRTTHSLAVC